MKRFLILAIGITLLNAEITGAQNTQNKRDTAVRKDKTDLSQNDAWIYDDFESARQQAERSKKPMMVVFR
jgi:hypothetical protein